jgi:6-phosphofructokinase
VAFLSDGRDESSVHRPSDIISLANAKRVKVYCIGFGTAVSRSVEYITQLRTPVGSHERLGLVELFGRNSGETALIASYLAGVDRALISEVPFNIETLAEMLVRDKRDNPSNYAICTMSEGATIEGGDIVERGEEDAYGHKKLGGIGGMSVRPRFCSTCTDCWYSATRCRLVTITSRARSSRPCRAGTSARSRSCRP